MRMKSLNCMKHASVLAAVALPILVASAAHAAPCADLTNPVYVYGSTASRPFVAQAALSLAKAEPPVSIVYIGAGSQNGVNALASDAKVAPPSSASVPHYWPANNTAGLDCELPTDGQGVRIDIGVSDAFDTSFGDAPLPNTVKDYFGPIQAMTFVVPTASSQTSISAEAAYLTWGFDEGGGETPWDVTAFRYHRSNTSGTKVLIAKAINVPVAKWKGVNCETPTGGTSCTSFGSGDVLNKVINSSEPDKTIGILSTDVADGNITVSGSSVSARTKLRILAYQHYGQSCGYLPDSTSTSYDKQNVRDGHYEIWGPLHFFARTSDGEPENEHIGAAIQVLTGEGNDEERAAFVDLAAKGHVVPDCAMRVRRETELGPLSSYMPARSCECRFIAQATGEASPEGCTKCDDSSDCSGDKPVCNYGFCEVR